jgi:hypothetical protein
VFSQQSAPVQPCDSLHAYDHFSKVEANVVKVDRGGDETAANRAGLDAPTAARTMTIVRAPHVAQTF